MNKAHVERLEAEGLMTPAGRAAVERAQAERTWTALDGVEALEVPPDLAAALEGSLREVWESWPRSVKRGALEILLNTRRPETLAPKLAAIREAAETGQRPFQWRGR